MSASNLGSPQSLNLYAYTQNNPIDFSDPSGLNKELPGERGQSGILYTLYYGNNNDDYRALFSWFVPNGGGGDGEESGGGESEPKYGNQGVFTEDQIKKIKDALKFINSWQCKDAINRISRSNF